MFFLFFVFLLLFFLFRIEMAIPLKTLPPPPPGPSQLCKLEVICHTDFFFFLGGGEGCKTLISIVFSDCVKKSLSGVQL